MDLIRPTLISIWIIHPGLFQESLEFYMDMPQASKFFPQFLYGQGSGIPRGFQGSYLIMTLIALEQAGNSCDWPERAGRRLL